jgi:hypothetical protein
MVIMFTEETDKFVALEKRQQLLCILPQNHSVNLNMPL